MSQLVKGWSFMPEVYCGACGDPVPRTEDTRRDGFPNYCRNKRCYHVFGAVKDTDVFAIPNGEQLT